MKYLVMLLLGLLLAAAGFFAGSEYEKLNGETKSEDVIGKEVALLEKYKGTPDCEKVRASVDSLNMDKVDGVIVVWFYNQSNDMLKRLVVDRSFTTGYEELDKYCQGNG